jgi:hypothetical protein
MFALAFLGCEHNPFDEDAIAYKKNSLTGIVEQNSPDAPEKVFVWLEGFDIGTWTNAAGDFKINLPPQQIQPGGGVSGSFKLFFYVSNFQLDSSTIAVQNGELKLSYGDIDENGRLRDKKHLIKTLHIQTGVSPSSVQENYSGPISVELVLQAANDRDTVYVKYPDKAEGPLAVLFFKNVEAVEDSLLIFEHALLADNFSFAADSISAVPKVWSSAFQFSPNFLPRGTYQVIPFFIICDQIAPVALLKNFSDNIEKPDKNFVKVPTTRSGGIFSVTPRGDT